MSKVHEITAANSVVHYCDSCRLACMHSSLKRHVTAKCMVRDCTFCGEKKLVNVFETEAIYIPLDEHGVVKDTYVEREGV